MIMIRRRDVIALSGMLATAIGLLAVTSIPGASAASAKASESASTSAPASATEGHTHCVPWPKPASLGLKCTGTYGGTRAWNPWTWHEISQQPVVTVSQTKDLTDQGVQITWSDFTPSLDNGNLTPNPDTQNPLYQVSIFECKGTNPRPTDPVNGFPLTQCYQTPVGTSLGQANGGPPNGLTENTLDTSLAPKPTCKQPGLYPSSVVVCLSDNEKSSWDGGSPATWTGQADFHVEAPTPRSQGGFFNCGRRTPCSLVIVPNWGGTPGNQVINKSTPDWTDTSNCSQHWIGGGLDPPGNPSSPFNPLNNPSPLSTGDLLGQTSGGAGSVAYAESTSLPSLPAALSGASYACWAANRIVIPLSFGPTPQDCPNKAPEFYAQGSPMMQTQMLQWQAGWCNGRAPVTLNSTFNSESLARDAFLASGGQSAGARTDMALVTLPVTAAQQKASSRKFTYAPLANSGTGIAYSIDDPATGSQINRMVLNPRLLAKLTTQSYTLEYGCVNFPPPPWKGPDHPSPYCDPAVLHHNAFSLFDDPEFLSLNKHCQPYGQPADYTCVNSAVDRHVQRDDFPLDNNGGNNSVQIGGFLPTVLQANSDMTYDLTGWIGADPDARRFLDGKTDPWGMHVNTNYRSVAYPESAFNKLDNGVTYPGGLPACTANCGNLDNELLDESMQASWNFQQDLNTITSDLLTDQPTAAWPFTSCGLPNGACTNAHQFNTQTGASAQFLSSRALLSELDLGDIAGYGLPAAELVNLAGKAVGPTQASVEAAVSDMKTNPDGITQYFDFASKNKNAYPLAMVDYAMVPTCGLSHTTASAIADFLTKAATTGQTQGQAPGDLAPGYYPLTAKQKAQTLKAAQEVKAQTCKSPKDDDTAGGHHATTPASSTSPSASASPDTTPGQSPSPSASISPIGKARTLAFGQKASDSGLAGILELLAIILGALLVAGGPAAWVITVTGRWPVMLRWVRAVRARIQAWGA